MSDKRDAMFWLLRSAAQSDSDSESSELEKGICHEAKAQNKIGNAVATAHFDASLDHITKYDQGKGFNTNIWT